MGYRLNHDSGKLKIDEQEAEIVGMIFDLYVNKRIGTTTISAILNDKGYRTRKGTLFGKNYIRLILLNPTYVGSLVYGKNKVQIQRTYDENYNLSKSKKMVKSNDPIIVENCHEPIIDNNTFLRASEIMKKHNKQQTVSNRAKYH